MADELLKGRFIAALTALGASAGNDRLREALQWDEPTYTSVRDELFEDGIVTMGRGRGGI